MPNFKLSIFTLWIVSLSLTMTIFSFSAHAAEEQKAEEAKAEEEIPAPPPGLYQPEFCEFPVTFPEKPYAVRRCDDGGKEKCYDLVSYTKVYDMQSTVNFRVICNPIGKDIKDNYTGEVMQATLKAMTGRSVVEAFNTSFREEKEYKQAGLVGEGRSGKLSTVYIAQLWIGGTSALSVEAELIGDAHEDADTLLKDVLKSISYAPVKITKSAEAAPDKKQ